MMNQYPWWKYAILGAALLLGIVYSIPNLYPPQPALSITAEGEFSIDQSLQTKLTNALKKQEIKYLDAEIIEATTRIGETKLVISFANQTDQAKARPVIIDEIPRGYPVVFYKKPTTPDWLTALGAAPMNLGLDLSGGVYFLIEVDLDAAVIKSLKTMVEDLKSRMVDEDIEYDVVTVQDGVVVAEFFDNASREKAHKLFRKEIRDVKIESLEGNRLSVAYSEQGIRDVKQNAVQQNIVTLRNRINTIGVAEPVVQKQGENRIVVELPGVQDPNEAKGILNATATLEFRMVAKSEGPHKTTRTEAFPEKGKTTSLVLEEEVLVTGDSIVNARSGFDSRNNEPAVFVTLDDAAASRFAKKTGERVDDNMAIIFIENKYENVLDENGKPLIKDGKYVRKAVLVREVISNAVIRSQLGRNFQISGQMSTKETHKLAILLQAGALAAPIDIVEERTVGPKLGQQNINRGFTSIVIGLILVLLFMLVYYRLFGLIADLALLFNLVLIVGIMSILGTMVQASLTLPGIAGIVLTVGMAVDANVLIFERIREEIRNGNSPQSSIQAGYEKAIATIADANITTLIAAVVLYVMGTGPIQGFAVTLSIGIATSMFTAIMGTRAIVNFIYGGRRVSKLSI